MKNKARMSFRVVLVVGVFAAALMSVSAVTVATAPPAQASCVMGANAFSPYTWYGYSMGDGQHYENGCYSSYGAVSLNRNYCNFFGCGWKGGAYASKDIGSGYWVSQTVATSCPSGTYDYRTNAKTKEYNNSNGSNTINDYSNVKSMSC